MGDILRDMIGNRKNAPGHSWPLERLKLCIIIFLAFTIIPGIAINRVHAQEECRHEYASPLKFVNVDSMRIAYTDIGKGSVCIFIHGLGGSINHWKQNTGALAAEGFRCIAVDLPGCGASSKPATDTVSAPIALYTHVITVMAEQLKLTKVTLVGYDLGGAVAIAAALQQPKWLKQIVLASPAGVEKFTEDERKLLATFSTPRFFRNQDSLKIAATIKSNFFVIPPESGLLINERVGLKECGDFEAYCKWVAIGIKGGLTLQFSEQLSLLKIPVLWIYGEQDAIMPNQMMHPEMTAAEIALSGIIKIKKCTNVALAAGHMVQWEQPALFNAAVNAFLKQR